MSVLLSCQSVSKAFLDRILFKDLQFSIYENDKVGLIGSNGAGKSTLLKMLCELEEIDTGEVTKRNNLHVTYIPQLENFPDEQTVFETLTQAAQKANLPDVEAAVNITLGKCGFSTTKATLEDLSGTTKAKLDELPNKEAQVKTLSGGWKKRLSLACGFIEQSELVLLDEPTNHLDLDGVLWLEQYLKDAPFSWLTVSHDRIFLETSTNKIAEIDKVYPQGIFVSQGTLGAFLRAKSEFLASEQQRASSLQNKVKREQEWLSRQPKARGTKSKSRIEKAHSLMEDLSDVKQRMQKKESEIDFSGSNRKTKRLFEAKEIAKTLGSKELFKEASFVLSPKMRVGILGPNGSGKTTLLKIIAGQLETDRGAVKYAKNLQTVYFDQHRAKLNLNETLKDSLAPQGDSVVYQGREIHVASWAARFQFRIEQFQTLVKDLSGGEQARLLIARLMLEQADLLLLDEPTNDLDIETLEVLEESLLSFPGAVVLISHDRYLMGRVCNGFLGLDGRANLYPCASFEQWLRDSRKANLLDSDSRKADLLDKPKMSFEERKEYNRMEKAIAKAEATVSKLEEQAYSPEIVSDPEQAKTKVAELAEANKKVEQLYARWEELEKLL